MINAAFILKNNMKCECILGTQIWASFQKSVWEPPTSGLGRTGQSSGLSLIQQDQMLVDLMAI